MQILDKKNKETTTDHPGAGQEDDVPF